MWRSPTLSDWSCLSLSSLFSLLASLCALLSSLFSLLPSLFSHPSLLSSLFSLLSLLSSLFSRCCSFLRSHFALLTSNFASGHPFRFPSMGGVCTAQHSAVQHAEPPKLTWATAVCSRQDLQRRWPVGLCRGNRKSESHAFVAGKALGPTEEYLSAPSGCSDPWRCSRCSFDAASRVLLPRCPGDPSTTTSSTPSSLDM